MLKHSEHSQVLHLDLTEVAVLVRDGKSSALSRSFVLSVNPPTILDASLSSSIPAIPVQWMVTSIRPQSNFAATIGKVGECLIVCKLNVERAARRKLQKLAFRWRDLIAAIISMEPPLLLSQLIKR